MSVAGVSAARDKVRAGVPIIWAWMVAVGRRFRTGLAYLWAGLRAGAGSLGKGSAWAWAHTRAGSIRLGHLLAAGLAALQEVRVALDVLYAALDDEQKQSISELANHRRH